MCSGKEGSGIMGRKIKDPKKATTIIFDFDNYYFIRYFMELNKYETQSETVNAIVRDYALQFVTEQEAAE